MMKSLIELSVAIKQMVKKMNGNLKLALLTRLTVNFSLLLNGLIIPLK